MAAPGLHFLDETTAVTTGDAKVTFRMPCATGCKGLKLVLRGVRA